MCNSKNRWQLDEANQTLIISIYITYIDQK